MSFCVLPAIHARKSVNAVLIRVFCRNLESRTPSHSSTLNPIFAVPAGLILPSDYLQEIIECREKVGKIASDFVEKDAALMKDSFEYANKSHRGQFRKRGEAYITHPCAVAQILHEQKADAETLAMGLLHDVIEDGRIDGERITRKKLEEKFGKEITFGVDGVSELGKLSDDEKLSDAEMILKLLEYGIKDIRILQVKLADRLHNLRTLGAMPRAKQIKKARETLNVHAKIADRLGMWELKRELEDLCFMYLEPEKYQAIKNARDEIVYKEFKGLTDAKKELVTVLKENGIKGRVIIECRGVYELSQRMAKRGITEETSYDVWRLSVVVPESNKEGNCFSALGCLDVSYGSVTGTTQIHIGRPKANDHQFIETAISVYGIGNILIHIMDEKMYRGYRYGIFAKPHAERKNNWIADVLRELREEGITSEEELGRVILIHCDPVRVCTPKDRKREFPFGATVLDFARWVHEEVFLHAVGAKIDKRPCSLFDVLRDGSTIEIITDPTSYPNIDWINHVTMPEAKSALRSFLRKRSNDILFLDAMRLLQREAEKLYMTSEDLVNTKLFWKFYGPLGYIDPVLLLFDIGRGERSMADVASGLKRLYFGYEKTLIEDDCKREPYYLGAWADNRPGIYGKLGTTLGNVGLNITSMEDFPFIHSNGRIFLVFGVDVFVDQEIGGIVSEIQRIQAGRIASATLGGYGKLLELDIFDRIDCWFKKLEYLISNI